jgi:hypothetical protein
MKIYLLKRTEQIGYDEADGFVVAADNPAQARAQAADSAGDEGGATWQAPSRSTCHEINPARQQYGVILRSYCAG